MIVTLDGERVQGPATRADSLAQVVERVRDELLDDRIVVEIALNGEILTGTALEEHLATPLTQTDQVDLASADPRELAVEALREMSGRLAQASEAHSANRAGPARGKCQRRGHVFRGPADELAGLPAHDFGCIRPDG